MPTQTVGEIIYLAIDYHPPTAIERQTVTCKCGWRGENYLTHVAQVADSELATARYTLVDKSGRQGSNGLPLGGRPDVGPDPLKLRVPLADGQAVAIRQCRMDALPAHPPVPRLGLAGRPHRPRTGLRGP
jgi:hypothetical protein